MQEQIILAEHFEKHRTHLRAVAYRMLGSLNEADDAVQESWLHLSRSDTSDVLNLGGWLTTVVGRICLDMLRSRKARPEESLDVAPTDSTPDEERQVNPEEETLMAESVGLALLVVLNNLTPAERLAFVLHDIFSVSFEDIAPIVDRSVVATRQLASRARRRVRGAPELTTQELTRQKEVTTAFLAAARAGEFQALLSMLDPDVSFRVDPTLVLRGAAPELHGSHAVASALSGRAITTQAVMVNGQIGAVVAPLGKLLLVFQLTMVNDKITAIDAIGDPDHLNQLELNAFTF